MQTPEIDPFLNTQDQIEPMLLPTCNTFQTETKQKRMPTCISGTLGNFSPNFTNAVLKSCHNGMYAWNALQLIHEQTSYLLTPPLPPAGKETAFAHFRYIGLCNTRRIQPNPTKPILMHKSATLCTCKGTLCHRHSPAIRCLTIQLHPETRQPNIT
jgi:hypothetical protein